MSSKSYRWFLHYNYSQHGPYSAEQVQQDLKNGKIPPSAYAWRRGMQDWAKIEIIDFSESPQETAPEPTRVQQIVLPAAEKEDHRQAPRRPLTAQVISTDQKEVSFGICKDISETGMQVLTHQIPGGVGTKISINFTPDGLPAFVAHGTIVRLLTDGNGFSFKFENLDDTARKTIKSYS